MKMKKLNLKRETIRELAVDELKNLAGAWIPSKGICPATQTCTCHCPTDYTCLVESCDCYESTPPNMPC
jgi:hypothetical protein